MAENPKVAVAPPKKKVIKCDKICAYAGSGKEPQRCKGKCSREMGHILDCKCRTHDMQ